MTFKIRNPPNFGEELDNYYTFLEEIDSNDLISGPIVANPRTKTKENIKPTTYEHHNPHQYSFKDSTITNLNNMLAITLFFEFY